MIIFEKTATGLKKVQEDKLVKSLQWEEMHNSMLVTTRGKANQLRTRHGSALM